MKILKSVIRFEDERYYKWPNMLSENRRLVYRKTMRILSNTIGLRSIISASEQTERV